MILLVRDKYGQGGNEFFEEEEEEDDEEEDETGELVTPEIDAQILKTIALLRSKEPKIYDTNTRFFDETDLEKAQEAWTKKQKSLKDSQPVMTLKDFHRRELLAKLGPNGEYVSREDETDESGQVHPSPGQFISL